MASGSVLIVDNRGGWRQMVEHGKTGWRCGSERDFIYYASKMACEPNLRDDMAEAARARGLALGGQMCIRDRANHQGDEIRERHDAESSHLEKHQQNGLSVIGEVFMNIQGDQPRDADGTS